MKKILYAAFLLLALYLPSLAIAQDEEPTIYVIKKGDTLWGLSERFIRDPFYWPNLWERNQVITNPHFVFPGQRVKIYPDRIEVEKPAEKVAEPKQPQPVEKKEEPVPAKTFAVTGGEGFLMEKAQTPAGFIVSTYQNRQMVGEDDVVYTDIGRRNGVEVGSRFSVFKRVGPITHPISNVVLGDKVVPLGTLQLSELEEKVSKAIITKSFQEIGAGAFLTPYRPARKEVALKAADKELTGYIVETKMGNNAVAAGDVVYLDLGKTQGAEAGNLLYIVRDVVPDQKYALDKIDKLPVEVIGALVVVETGETTSTALIVKSIEAIYRGDRVELKKN
ncbi:LysM domain-containing protein [Geotalea sp. SG265]|uniref:LysM peptidoglycan-binding domain-containing protein n=1 Tax=Geotalea sp. SG265 TaxID=2922867 RepID=UPI001FAFC962|nr:LysM domain-containing protein [Geotalea sp. SG265]